MFKNLGRRAKFFLAKEVNKERSTVEGNVLPHIAPTPITPSGKTPDEIRNQMMKFARHSQEKAA